MPSRYDQYATHHVSRRTDGWDYTQPAAYFVAICTEDRVCLFGKVQQGRMTLNSLGYIVAEEWERSEEIRDRVHLDAFVVMPNHLHGIVVFADPDVDAPTSPRGYRVFGAGESASTEQTGDSPSTSDDSPVPPDSPDSSLEGTAVTGGLDNPSGSGRADGEPASHGGADDPSESNPSPDDNASRRRAGETPDSSNSEKASTRRSTLGGGTADRPTGPAPRSLGSFVAGFKSAATTRINDHRDTPGAPVWQRNLPREIDHR